MDMDVEGVWFHVYVYAPAGMVSPGVRRMALHTCIEAHTYVLLEETRNAKGKSRGKGGRTLRYSVFSARCMIERET